MFGYTVEPVHIEHGYSKLSRTSNFPKILVKIPQRSTGYTEVSRSRWPRFYTVGHPVLQQLSMNELRNCWTASWRNGIKMVRTDEVHGWAVCVEQMQKSCVHSALCDPIPLCSAGLAISAITVAIGKVLFCEVCTRACLHTAPSVSWWLYSPMEVGCTRSKLVGCSKV